MVDQEAQVETAVMAGAVHSLARAGCMGETAAMVEMEATGPMAEPVALPELHTVERFSTAEGSF
jgi:hypothetical protein